MPQIYPPKKTARREKSAYGVDLTERRPGETTYALKMRTLNLLREGAADSRAHGQYGVAGGMMRQYGTLKLEIEGKPRAAQAPTAKGAKKPRYIPEVQKALDAHQAKKRAEREALERNGLRTSNPNYTDDYESAGAYGAKPLPHQDQHLGGYGNLAKHFAGSVRGLEKAFGGMVIDAVGAQQLLSGQRQLDGKAVWDPVRRRMVTTRGRVAEAGGTAMKNVTPGVVQFLDEDPVAMAENALASALTFGVLKGASGAGAKLLPKIKGKIAAKSLGKAFEREAKVGGKAAEAHPAFRDHSLTSAVHDVDDTGILRPKDPDMVELEPGKHAIREIIWRDWIKNKDQGLFANKAQREETLRLVDLLDYDLVSRLRVRISKEAESSVKGVTAGGNYDFVEYVSHLSRVISHEIGTKERNATRVLAHEMAHHLQHFMTQADVDAIKDQYLRELKRRDKRIFDPLRSPRRWDNAEEWWASQIEEMLFQKVSGPRFNDASPEFVKATKEFWRSLVGMMDTTRRFFLRGSKFDAAKRIYNDMTRMSEQMKNAAFQPWDLEHGKPPIGKQLEGIIPPQGGPRRR